jgi:hypothetical protein
LSIKNSSMLIVSASENFFVVSEWVFVLSTKDEELDLPSLYWITLLHKCHFKQRYIAGCQMPHTTSFQIINRYSIVQEERDLDCVYSNVSLYYSSSESTSDSHQPSRS